MWEDLQKEPRLLRSAVRRFMEVTEQLGYAMGEEKLEEDVVVVVTSNICKLQRLQKQSGDLCFFRRSCVVLVLKYNSSSTPFFFEATFAITESHISLLSKGWKQRTLASFTTAIRSEDSLSNFHFSLDMEGDWNDYLTISLEIFFAIFPTHLFHFLWHLLWARGI